VAQPWEKYAAPQPKGPWEKYSAPPPAAPASSTQEDQPVLSRALSNLPSSAMHFLGNLAHPFGGEEVLTKDANGNYPPVRGPLWELGDMLSGLGSIALSPEESFAQDPVGTVGYPLMALKGGIEAVRHPTTQSIGRGVVSQVGQELPDIHKWGKAGAAVGGVLGGGGLESILHEGGTGYGVGAGARAIPAIVRGIKTGYQNRPQWPDILPVMPKQIEGPSPFNMPPVADTSGPVPFTPPESWSKPSTVDISSSLESSPIQPVQPQPQGEIVRGVHLPEVPPHYAGEPNPTAAFKNDQAIVQELRKVPGITQDTLTPDMVHETRKALGHRPLKPADVERRVGHIRMLLPK